MPYAIRGKSVIKKTTGKVVGHSQNPKQYMRVLQAVEHGWKPTGKPKMGHSPLHTNPMPNGGEPNNKNFLR